MDAKLICTEGAVKFSINGEIIEPLGFMTYNIDSGQFQRMNEIGNRIVFYTICASDRGFNSLAGIPPLAPHYFIAPDKYDFSEVDRVLSLIAPDGKGPYIIPRVYIAAPLWWEELYPEECAKNYLGNLAGESFGSQRWREDMWGALRALVDHINASPWRELVIGYHVCAGSTEEWTPHDCGRIMKRTDMDDYSECNRRQFVRWLCAKYGNVNMLNEAWGAEYSDFDEIEIPVPNKRIFSFDGILRDPSREQSIIDFDRFTSDQMADAICYFNRKLKEYSDNGLITGAFYGYTNLHTNGLRGHFSLRRVLESPYVDFICTTNSRGRVSTYSTETDSVIFHKKLYVYEGDIRTDLTRPPAERMPWIDSGNSYYRGGVWLGPDHKTSVADLKRTSARVAISRTGLWWFDMFGGAFAHPDFEEIMIQHQKLVKEQTDGPIKTEVAFITDENAVSQFGLDGAAYIGYAGRKQREEVGLTGAPYHVYLADDLCRDDFPFDNYRAYIFGYFCRPSEAVIHAIETKLKRDGKILIWTGFSGIENKELVDFEVKYDNASPDIQCKYMKSAFPRLKGPFTYDNTDYSPTYPDRALPAPRFADGADSDAYVLGRVSDSNEPCLLLKQKENYTSVYSLLPSVPNQVLHVLMTAAGVHTYSVTGDALMAGGRYISLRSTFAGEKRIYLPPYIKSICDVETGEQLEIKYGYGYVDFLMADDEIRIFAVE